jgi:hypothetical protein
MNPSRVQYRLVIHARPNPPRTYSHVITQIDDLYWSKMGSEAFQTPDEAAEVGGLAIEHLISSNPI